MNGEPTESGSGGNDVWISFAEVPDYSILPPSSDFIPDDNEGRYQAWSAALNASDEWIRATAYPHPEYDDAAFFQHDLGVLVLELVILSILSPALTDNHRQFVTLARFMDEARAVSIIGIAVVPLILCAMLVAWIIGKAAGTRWIGMSVMPAWRDSRLHTVSAFVIGFVLFVLGTVVVFTFDPSQWPGTV